jgi:hypothetical protein
MSAMHEAYKKVLKSKGNSIELTMQWFNTPIFELNNRTPNDLLKKDKQKVVINYILKHF